LSGGKLQQPTKEFAKKLYLGGEILNSYLLRRRRVRIHLNNNVLPEINQRLKLPNGALEYFEKLTDLISIR
jgi:hypothetical protein